MRYPGVRLLREATEKDDVVYEPMIIDTSVNPPRMFVILTGFDNLHDAMECAKEELRKFEKFAEELEK